MAITLKQLAKKLDLTWSGQAELLITRSCGLKNLKPGGIGFLADAPSIANVATPNDVQKSISKGLEAIPTESVAMIVPKAMKSDQHNLIYSDDPLTSHIAATKILHPSWKPEPKIHPTAVIGKDVTLGNDIAIEPYAVIYDEVTIGDRTIVHAGAVIMKGSTIGADSIIHPGVVICENSVIGNQVILHPGSIIGADGHGYYQRNGHNKKIPQVGKVILGDEVEIGACTTVDRGRLEDTIIKHGSKLDNQVQIGHNVELGDQALISAQSAIGGSTKTGSHLILGGQSGIKDHVQVGNHVTAVARSVITAKTDDKSVVGGMPARPVNEWRKTQVLIHQLDELHARIKKLEKVTRLQE